jgi:hypothetical protein
MNYIRLTNLTNTYPQPGNYIPQAIGDATLFGIYEETNRVDFNLVDFSEVIPVKNISTRFIIAVTYDKGESTIVDEDESEIDTPLDVNNNEKIDTNPQKSDSIIDKFIGISKKSKRKKKVKLAAKIAGAIGAVALAPGLLTVGAIAFGFGRIKKRKQERANSALAQRQSSEDIVVKPTPNPLGITQQKDKNRAIARRNERRDRIFGTTKNVENSSSISKKEQLTSDSNTSKQRIFSDLKITNNDNVATKLFCSEQYYNDLKSAKSLGNPYFINFSFKPEFLIEVNALPLIELMDSFLDAELTNGVLMKRNNYLIDGNIDFEKLAQYVNWVVSKPTLAEIDTNGVIPANLLCEYEKGDFDKKSGKWNTAPNQTSNTTTDTSTNNTTANTTQSEYPPVGRVGTTTGEIVDVDGDSYVWLGSFWRPIGGGASGDSGPGGRR